MKLVAWICGFCRRNVEGDGACPGCGRDRNGGYPMPAIAPIPLQRVVELPEYVKQWERFLFEGEPYTAIERLFRRM